jgi:hypothetical protein
MRNINMQTNYFKHELACNRAKIEMDSSRF